MDIHRAVFMEKFTESVILSKARSAKSKDLRTEYLHRISDKM